MLQFLSQQNEDAGWKRSLKDRLCNNGVASHNQLTRSYAWDNMVSRISWRQENLKTLHLGGLAMARQHRCWKGKLPSFLNCNIFGSIQIVKRNNLTCKRLEILLYIHKNLRCLSRKQKEYTHGPSKYLDLGKIY